MNPKTRKRLFDVIRVAICGLALWVVVRGVTLRDRLLLSDGTTLSGTVEEGDPIAVRLPDNRLIQIPLGMAAKDKDGAPRISYGLISAWRKSDKVLLLLAVAIYFPLVFPLAERFRILLRAQGIKLGFGQCIRLTFAGNFLNFATPLGSNAGDLFKAYFASLHTHRKTEAVTTVILDRVIGLGTLVTIAAGITVFSAAGSRLAMLRPYMLVLLAVGGVAAVLYFSSWFRRLSLPVKWHARIPALAHLRRVDQAVRILAGRSSTLVAAVLLTMLLQLLALSSYFVAAIALSLKANWGNVLEYFAYFYAGAVIQALPGPPQGLGTVELAYRYFLADYGSPSQIVCLAFAIRVIVLVCSLPGLLVTLTGAYKPADWEAALSDVPSGEAPSTSGKQELAAL